jgi:ATP-dependent DNA helicase RecG
VGTHAVLSYQQYVQNLALVVIDEQHRFGVKQRSQLLDQTSDGKTPHLLTMTATPIPRTIVDRIKQREFPQRDV